MTRQEASKVTGRRTKNRAAKERTLDAHFAAVVRICAGCADQARGLCNQDFFVKIYIDEDDTIRPGLTEPLNIIVDPTRASKPMTGT